MERYLLKLSLLFTVSLVILVSCSKEDEQTNEQVASTFTVYKNQTGDVNADALQAQNIDSKGTLNFYGAFDSENNPREIRTLTYQKANSDTIVYLIMDPLTNRLASSYFSVKGVKSPVVLKFDYIQGVNNAYNLSYYNYNWKNETSELFYAARVETNNGVASSNPFFANRGVEDDVKLLIKTTVGSIAYFEIIVPIIPGLVNLGASVLTAAAAAPVLTAAAIGAAVVIFFPKDGFSKELDYTPSNLPPPSKTPIVNPVSATSNPTPKLQPSSCVNTNMTFRASMDAEGNIMITEVVGGTSPHSYMVTSGFQQSQVFPNKYKDGSYVVGIKDANGCVSVQLVSLKRAIDCASSTLSVTTSSTTDSATAIVTGGQSPYTYAWSNGSTSATATNLLAGIYTVTVTDNIGCKQTANATVLSSCEDTTTPYPTITIGTQVWMQKNLNVCKYRNGDPIPQVTDPTQWGNLTTGAWCYYENNTANGTVYGKLYNWYAVNDPRGLAPVGFHVPSETEWNTLVAFLGGFNIAGGKMKATGTTLWKSPNVNATNTSGFTGLPGGYRSADGNWFSHVGEKGYWWSRFELNALNVYRQMLDYDNDDTNSSEYRMYSPQGSGYSVRCVKD